MTVIDARALDGELKKGSGEFPIVTGGEHA
jgi:hypothetical protein